ncbi:MAG: response regulator transcription factor [Elusimicrobia bacterium]|nr:response regulator transcription factor [Elusimicrobiota bacterium]
MSPRALALIESDDRAAKALERVLSGRGYEVWHYETPGRFFDGLLKRVPQIVLVGLPLPGMEGTDVLRVLRGNAETKRLCVVVLDGQGRPARAADGLDAGADEYLPKPVDADLLVARLTSLLFRVADEPAAPQWVKAGELAIDLDGHACKVKDKEVKLTPIEFELIRQFLQLENRVLTRGSLLQTVWHGDPSVSPRTIDKHVESLRKKLGPFGKRIETVFGVGYRLRAA